MRNLENRDPKQHRLPSVYVLKNQEIPLWSTVSDLQGILGEVEVVGPSFSPTTGLPPPETFVGMQSSSRVLNGNDGVSRAVHLGTVGELIVYVSFQ